jgi:hypothetical protein
MTDEEFGLPAVQAGDSQEHVAGEIRLDLRDGHVARAA